jgi:hypothetical protein
MSTDTRHYTIYVLFKSSDGHPMDTEGESMCYVGSTGDFYQRRKSHKSDCHLERSPRYHDKRYEYIRENGGWDEWEFAVLEEGEMTRQQAHKREGIWMGACGAQLNVVPTCGDPEELRKRRLERAKKNYYDPANREKFHVKHECELCGGRYAIARFYIHERTKKHQRALKHQREQAEKEATRSQTVVVDSRAHGVPMKLSLLPLDDQLRILASRQLEAPPARA